METRVLFRSSMVRRFSSTQSSTAPKYISPYLYWPLSMLLCPASWGDPLGKEGAMEEGAARGSDRRGSVSRLNVYIAGTAAIIGIIYGYDLGSIASAILFLQPDLNLSTFMVSVVTATVVLGQLFGALFAGPHHQHDRDR